jgi:general secretion pathway protein A
VDEAQNLAPTVLEQVRLLTNLETNTRKLLQIILIGQPELRELLARNELRQLAQRITGRYHLNPLTLAETAAYVRHRLRVAGATSDIFSPTALSEVHRLATGVPRVINVVCDRALLGAYSTDRHRVTSNLVRHAAEEVFGKRFTPRWLPWLGATAAVALLVMTGALVWKARPWVAKAVPETVASSKRPSATVSNVGGAGTAALAANPGTPNSGNANPGGTAPNSAGIAGGTAAGDMNQIAGGAAGALINRDPNAATQTFGPRGATNTQPALSGHELTQLLATHKSETDTDSAFTKLFGLWRIRYTPATVDPCTQASGQGLECLTGLPS